VVYALSRVVNSFEKNIEGLDYQRCAVFCMFPVEHTDSYFDTFKVCSFYHTYREKEFCFDEIFYGNFELGFTPQDIFYRLYKTTVWKGFLNRKRQSENVYNELDLVQFLLLL